MQIWARAAAARYAVGRLRAATRRRPGPTVAIIGAGFGGVAAAVSLRQAGIDDLVIIEGADGVGGTWRRNVYPGAACDVPSHLYSFSFALNRAWSCTYAQQPEILAYLEQVVDDFDLRRYLILGTRVTEARWDDATQQWELQLQKDGRPAGTLRADVVVSAVGLFGETRLPDVDGLSGFRGRLMHTAAWDPGADLTGRKVAVIGTGASAVQVVPELARIADRVTVFQRTPPWMVPKDERAFTAEELAAFRRPWAARRERWRAWKQFHDFSGSGSDDPTMRERSKVATTFLEQNVADEGLREALTPHYPFRCKRVLLGDGYYRALQRDNVELVTDPIDRVTETGVVTAGGRVIDVDAIVCATGFEASRYLDGIEVIGRGGQSLHERWGCDPTAYLGVAVSGFPNFFMLYGPNTNQGGNSIIYILEAGARLVTSAVSRLARRGGSIEVRPEVETRYNEALSADLERSVWTQCDSYFRSPTGRIVTQWPHSELEYARRTWRLRPRDWIQRNPGAAAPSGLRRAESR
jgi:cation diffusion facilitator CzcD-associated flavoprotein CzcO